MREQLKIKLCFYKNQFLFSKWMYYLLFALNYSLIAKISLVFQAKYPVL